MTTTKIPANPNCEVCHGSGIDPMFQSECTECWGNLPGRGIGENTDRSFGSGTGTGHGRVVLDAASQAQLNLIEKLTREQGVALPDGFEKLSKRDASKVIDSLLEAGKAKRGAEQVAKVEDGRPNKYGAKCVRCGQWVEAEAGWLAKDANGKWAARHKGDCPEAKAQAPKVELTDGMYRLPNGDIYKVQIAHHGSGNLYAKRQVKLDEPVIKRGKEVTHEFEYAPGAMKLLKPEYKMTLEEAKAWGHLYGSCCVCGAVLTDDSIGGSIENGIGPICGSKGW